MLIMLPLLDFFGLAGREPGASLYGDMDLDFVGLGGRMSSPFPSMLIDSLPSGDRDRTGSLLAAGARQERILWPYSGSSSAGTSGERFIGWVKEVFTPARGCFGTASAPGRETWLFALDTEPAFDPLIDVERDIETEEEGVVDADLTIPRPLRGADRVFVRPAGMKGDLLRGMLAELTGIAEMGMTLSAIASDSSRSIMRSAAVRGWTGDKSLLATLCLTRSGGVAGVCSRLDAVEDVDVDRAGVSVADWLDGEKTSEEATAERCSSGFCPSSSVYVRWSLGAGGGSSDEG